MELPEQLKQRIEARAAAYPAAQLAQAAQSLSERYRKSSGQGRRLLSGAEQALAYAIARMPATYGAICRSLELALPCYGGALHSILDVGAGTGAGSWAAQTLLGELQYTCLEREPAMIELGQALMAEQAELARAKWLRQDINSGLGGQQADLVLAAYTLGELTEEDRARATEVLWNAARGMLLLVEPGTPAGFAGLRRAREQLLAQGAQVAAPCPHGNACPMAAEDWCHFTVRVTRSRLHRLCKGGEAPFEDEKFAFLAVCRSEAKPAAARILRHPQKAGGHIGLTLCGAQGIERCIVSKKQRDAFRQARKAEAGAAFDGTEPQGR